MKNSICSLVWLKKKKNNHSGWWPSTSGLWFGFQPRRLNKPRPHFWATVHNFLTRYPIQGQSSSSIRSDGFWQYVLTHFRACILRNSFEGLRPHDPQSEAGIINGWRLCGYYICAKLIFVSAYPQDGVFFSLSSVEAFCGCPKSADNHHDFLFIASRRFSHACGKPWPCTSCSHKIRCGISREWTSLLSVCKKHHLRRRKVM